MKKMRENILPLLVITALLIMTPELSAESGGMGEGGDMAARDRELAHHHEKVAAEREMMGLLGFMRETVRILGTLEVPNKSDKKKLAYMEEKLESLIKEHEEERKRHAEDIKRLEDKGGGKGGGHKGH